MDFSWLDWTTKLVDLPKDKLNWWKVKEKIHRELLIKKGLWTFLDWTEPQS